MASNDTNKTIRKGNTIEVKLSEYQSPEKLTELKRQIIEWSKERRYDVIVDVVEPKIGSGETRAAAEKFFEGLPYRKFAIWGGSPPVNLSIKSLVEAHADGEHVKIFRREEDARAWLKEETR